MGEVEHVDSALGRRAENLGGLVGQAEPVDSALGRRAERLGGLVGVHSETEISASSSTEFHLIQPYLSLHHSKVWL